MGIKDLKTLIGTVAEETTLDQFKGKKIVIDVSLYMYRFAYWKSNPIDGFRTQIDILRQHDIQPIYVFDGQPPMVKGPVLQERKERFEKMQEKKQQLETELSELVQQIRELSVESEDYEKTQAKTMRLRDTLQNHTKNIIRIRPEDFDNLRKLLTELEIEWHDAPTEADSLAAIFCCDGTVDAVMTEDMDALAFGCAKVITGFSNDNDGIKVFRLSAALELLHLPYRQFIDLCIMCGCDYVGRLFRIGPKTALRLIRQHGTIEAAMKHIDPAKHRVPENYLELVAKARELFLHPTNVAATTTTIPPQTTTTIPPQTTTTIPPQTTVK
jgi:flap endonuclease-1